MKNKQKGTDTSIIVHFGYILCKILRLRWIIGQIQEQAHVLHGSVLFKVLLKESSSLHVDSHGSEDNGEIVAAVVHDVLSLRAMLLDQASLATDLGSDLVVRQTSG